jgi:hypothetical protein
VDGVIEGEAMREPDGDDALVSRLRVIEDQPLEARAEAYGHVFEELHERLEGASNAGANHPGVSRPGTGAFPQGRPRAPHGDVAGAVQPGRG